MKRIVAFLAMMQLALLGAPALAQDVGSYHGSTYGSIRTVSTESWVEEWDPETGQWVRIADNAGAFDPNIPTVTTTYLNGEIVSQSRAATRYARPAAPRVNASMVAQYGPFIVTSATSASMVGPTNSATPRQFDAMLRDFPGIAMLEMIEAPGTSNDIANLAVGRRIRAAGIATHVPNGGSVRSGAVELFLAGVTRTMDHGAQFAVHSWLDNYGREADDFAADDPAHRLYLDYYVEMGMTEAQAREFYTMTNSVPHHSALWLDASDMRPWVPAVRTPAYRMAEAAMPVRAPAIFAFTQPALEAPLVEWDRVDIAVDLHAIPYGDLSAISLAQLDVSRLDSLRAFP